MKNLLLHKKLNRFLFYILFMFPLLPLLAQQEVIVKVLRVIDGDTFVLASGERVRLLGIDTPELDSKIQFQKDIAITAFNFTKQLIDGKTIKLTFNGVTKDLFGRTLAYAWLINRAGKDSLFLQAELLKAGLARILMYSKNKKYYYLFYNLRNTARRNKLGIWSQ